MSCADPACRAVCGRTEKNVSVDLFFFGNELKQEHAEKLRRYFLGCAAAETLRFKVATKFRRKLEVGSMIWSSKRGTREVATGWNSETRREPMCGVPSIRIGALAKDPHKFHQHHAESREADCRVDMEAGRAFLAAASCSVSRHEPQKRDQLLVSPLESLLISELQT